MDIKILPSNIANMIAAGEVVQRPSSAVKELMENAVDAGADQITVILTDAGRTLIQVIDNGCGMTPDEAVLCFERHATSKISTAEDLMDITTFGFRGEALASIAAVSEVTLKTRRAEDEVGCQVEFADSRHISTTEVSTPAGTSIAVRNLFYNVPARRKFLKSDNVELKHITEEFIRVALTRSGIGFRLMNNGKDLYVLKPAKSLKFRIQDLLGNHIVSQVVDLSADTSIVNIRGYVGRPDLAKKALGNQFFFINGRYFRSPYLHKAVMNAYENMLPQGTTPSYFIYLETDPHDIDVNISPTKTEVKFADDSVIFQTLYACVKEALGRNSFGASIDFDTAGMPEMPVFSNDFDKYRPEVSTPEAGTDPGYNPFDLSPAGSYDAPAAAQDFSGPMSGPMPGSSMSGSMKDYVPSPKSKAAGLDFPLPDYTGAGSPSSAVDRRDDYGKLFDERCIAQPNILIIQHKYIVSPVKSGMLVINIRRAKERILFEKFLRALSGGEHVSQCALFPVQVTVGVDNRLIFDEHAELLRTLGFDITPFGADSIVVNGMPEGFQVDQSSVESAMADILIALTENHTTLAGMMESTMAEKFARFGAAEGRPVESPSEARSLMDALFACSNSEYTNNGHKTMSIISTDELEKLF